MTEKERKLTELKVVLIMRQLNWYRDFSKEEHTELIRNCTDNRLLKILQNVHEKDPERKLIRKIHKERIQILREEREERSVRL